MPKQIEKLQFKHDFKDKINELIEVVNEQSKELEKFRNCLIELNKISRNLSEILDIKTIPVEKL